MASGYEKAYREIVPAARAALIAELQKKYKIKEEAISEYVGITQAAISKYVNGKYSSRIKSAVEKIDRNVIEAYAEKVAGGNKEEVGRYLCKVCNTLNSFNCKFSANK